MSSPTYPIVGIPVQPSQKKIPIRQEITAWVNNSDNRYQVSLFLRALAQIQNLPVTEKLGWFQIAGIHSYPLVPWDQEGQPAHSEGALPGFCNHNLVTFPTWHRTHLILLEQVLYHNMLDIIKGWGLSGRELETWTDAANQFRFPYWDWARPQPYIKGNGIPQICTLDTVSVAKPGASGSSETIENPLTGFLNPQRDSSQNRVPMGDPSMKENKIPANGRFPWNECIGVSRYGIVEGDPKSKWVNGRNNWQYANQAIADPQWYDSNKSHPSSSLADGLSRLFTPRYFSSWEKFASTAHNDVGDTLNTEYMSLEYIHNVIHDAAGGPFLSSEDANGKRGFKGVGLGHHADVPVAAFDPIFWLHHCNVDRICAIWQVLNWEKWFDKPSGNDPAPDAGLLPFHYDKQKSLWTSNRARDWRDSNFQYDDLKDMPAGPPSKEYQAQIQSHVDSLYKSTSSWVQDEAGLTFDDGLFHDYVINVVYDRYALNGRSYSILFYIGRPEQIFSNYKEDPHFVGIVSTFSAPLLTADGGVSCDNCGKQKEANVFSKAQVPITVPLIQLRGRIDTGAFQSPIGPLGPLKPEVITKILESELNWYFIEAGGRVMSPSEVPKTEIAVLGGRGAHPTEDRIMPRYQGYKKLHHATYNKKLGFGHDLGPNNLIHDDPGT